MRVRAAAADARRARRRVRVGRAARRSSCSGPGWTITVAPLTATALGAVESRLAGVASGVNNAVARTGSLIAVAAIPTLAGFVPDATVAAATLVDGFHRLVMIAAGVMAAAALLAWSTVGARRLPVSEAPPCFHCGASGPPPPVAVPAGTSYREV